MQLRNFCVYLHTHIYVHIQPYTNIHISYTHIHTYKPMSFVCKILAEKWDATSIKQK